MAARERLDGDAILLATALTLEREGAMMIATTNVRHLAQFADARLWSEIRVES